MTRSSFGRSAAASMAGVILLLATLVGSGLAQDSSGEHPVVGRWSITSDAGGAVWAFQPSGTLVVTGPGDILSEGTWTPAAGPDAFDATVAVEITGQQLEAIGQVDPGGTAIALYVTATEATRPDDWLPWPAESRLVGERFGMMVEETPQPSEPPLDCMRPQWVDGQVDWDRCDEAPAG
jgi:hypothetical protein